MINEANRRITELINTIVHIRKQRTDDNVGSWDDYKKEMLNDWLLKEDDENIVKKDINPLKNIKTKSIPVGYSDGGMFKVNTK